MSPRNLRNDPQLHVDFVRRPFDLDGLVTPHIAGDTVDTDREDFDFGYTDCGACRGKVTELSRSHAREMIAGAGPGA